jgi:murein hydrolase activator
VHKASTRIARRLLCCALLAFTGLAAAEADEAEARARLDKVRAEIARESQARGAVQASFAEANAALREVELAVAAAARTVAETAAELQQREQELQKAQAQRLTLETRLASQRAKLSTLLRSAYLLGRDQGFRALLAPDRIDDSARLVAYNRYLQRHRLDRMRGLLEQLRELTTLTREIELAKAALAVRRVVSESEIAQLQARRGEREALVRKLDARLADHQQRLRAYARDEQAVLGLLERLRDVLSDIPKQLSDARPMADLRGQLPWPLQGRVLSGFGSQHAAGRALAGIVIEADPGAEVQAIAHGRIAYADWLRGFGMLIIVDHGDGFMSLYANNEALLRDEGDWVQAGTALARAGASGGTDQPGLYFELRKNSQPLDPVRWLAKRG